MDQLLKATQSGAYPPYQHSTSAADLFVAVARLQRHTEDAGLGTGMDALPLVRTFVARWVACSQVWAHRKGGVGDSTTTYKCRLHVLLTCAAGY